MCVCAHTHSRLISIQLVVVNCVGNFVSVLNEISNENRKLISAVLGIFVSQGINGGECMDIPSVFDAQSKKCFHKSLKLNSK